MTYHNCTFYWNEFCSSFRFCHLCLITIWFNHIQRFMNFVYQNVIKFSVFTIKRHYFICKINGCRWLYEANRSKYQREHYQYQCRNEIYIWFRFIYKLFQLNLLSFKTLCLYATVNVIIIIIITIIQFSLMNIFNLSQIETSNIQKHTQTNVVTIRWP